MFNRFTIILACACTFVSSTNAQSAFEKARLKQDFYKRADSVKHLLFSRKLAFRGSFLDQNILDRYDNVSHSSFTAAGDCSYFCTALVVAAVGLELKASRINEKEVQLNWKTKAEYDCARFITERSFTSDARDFRAVSTYACAGNAYSETKYDRKDINDFAGTTWYRVRQVDIDGTFIYSNIVAVKGITSAPAMHVAPVPGRFDQVRISVTGLEANETAEATVYNVQGKLIAKAKLRGNAPGLALSSFCADPGAGLYILRLTNERVSLRSQFLITN